MAGKIDIERFQERYLAINTVEDEDRIKKESRLAALCETAHAMFSQPASNYQKAIGARLSEEQKQKLAAAESERNVFRRQALVEAVVVGFERSASMTAPQCAELTQILNAAVAACGSDLGLRSDCLRTIADLPEERIRPIFSEAEWSAVKRQLRKLEDVARQLAAEAAGKVAVFRDIRGEVQRGDGTVELEFQANELRLDVE
ncbi:MAG: hypothetical protein ACRD3W_16530 [Terriglobales bacterium]